jgi:polysaccharide export outer membrane protein
MIENVETDELSRLIVDLTEEIALVSHGTGVTGFPKSWLRGYTINPSKLGPGDQLAVSVWEPSDRPLIAGANGGSGAISATVARDGTLRLPFAPKIRARGLTLNELGQEIQEAMVALSSEVQVTVQLVGSHSREVSVQGQVSRPGILPIEVSTSRLSGMLARAGIAVDNPIKAQVQLTRAGQTRSVVLQDLYDDARLDVALRAGDRVVIRSIGDRYIMLGATTGQAEFEFSGGNFTLLQALAQGGGLRDDTASVSSIYLFRYESEVVARRLLGEAVLAGYPKTPDGRPIIYKLDMTNPAGIFTARLFKMRDGDTIVATHAPLTELRKLVSLFSVSLQPVTEVSRF